MRSIHFGAALATYPTGETDCASSTYGLTISNADTGMAGSPTLGVKSALSAYGGRGSSRSRSSRTISCTARLVGTSATDVSEKLRALNYLLDTVGGEKSIRFDDFQPDVFWMVFCSEGQVPAARLGQLVYEFELEFVAPDPRSYSRTEKSLSFTLDSSPKTISVEASGTAVGANAETDPVWVLTNGTGGPVGSVTLNNTTIGESITVALELADTDKLKIDRPRWIVERQVGGAGAWGSAQSAVNSTGVPPALLPLVENSVTVTGIDDGTLEVTYRERYL